MSRQKIVPLVRPEIEQDYESIRRVLEAAFGRPDEAALVASLRAEQAILLSLVAEVDDAVAGHILFSRMWIDQVDVSKPAASLAPLAVLPEYQGCGIGTALVTRALEVLRAANEQVVFVLGEPSCYGRFGFSAVCTRLIETPFPPASFMALELVPGALKGPAGEARYANSFGLA